MSLLDPSSLEDKILNLEKVLELDYNGQQTIKDLYNSLIWCASRWDPGDIGKIGKDWDPISFTQYFNTLNDHGYLVTIREKNLNQILDEGYHYSIKRKI